MKQVLPPIYAVYCVADRWFTIARSDRPHSRGLERTELRSSIGQPVTSRTPSRGHAGRLVVVSQRN